MEEAKNGVLQEVSPCNVLLLCFLHQINAAEASGSYKNGDWPEDNAPTRSVGRPPSYGKDQLPNSEQKNFADKLSAGGI
jgi:hypothetical protein